MKRQICEKHAGEVVLRPDMHGTDRCAVCAEIAVARREGREVTTKPQYDARAILSHALAGYEIETADFELAVREIRESIAAARREAETAARVARREERKRHRSAIEAARREERERYKPFLDAWRLFFSAETEEEIDTRVVGYACAKDKARRALRALGDRRDY